MEKKQSSIDWLEKEFVKLEATVGVHSVMYELIEKAKAMHKEEVQDAWLDESAIFDSEEKAENYYNKKFGGNNETH